MAYVSLTEAEWKIMLRLWDRSPQTMMELTRDLEPETGWSKHTVITMLKRMEKKGTVSICSAGVVKTYSPAVEKVLVAREQTETLLNRLFAGDAALLVRSLVADGRLTPQELSSLNGLIDHHTDPKTGTVKSERPV